MKIGSKTKVTREMTRQERNRRNNMKRITISALVAFIMFITLTVIQSSILNQEQKIAVYQFNADTPEGTKITEDNIDSCLTLANVQASLIPDGYITDRSQLIGKFTNRDYQKRDVLTIFGLVNSGDTYSSNIEHPVKVSFSTEDLSSTVSGTIREGNYVNIYGMKEVKNAENNETITRANEMYTFKHIYIDRAYTQDGKEITDVASEDEATMFTVIIDEEDVELFNEMIANCRLKVVKLMYTTKDDYKAYINTDADVDFNTVDTTTNIAEPIMTEESEELTEEEIMQNALNEQEAINEAAKELEQSAESEETAETADGETADGETADGETADGETSTDESGEVSTGAEDSAR